MDIEAVLDRNFTRITDKYKKFCLEKNKCKKCSLYHHYEQTLQSEGNAKDPTFMVIGEGPGKEEIEHNRPFVGRAGQRLRAELRKYPDTFRRDTVLISNILACRPLNNKFPSNDDSLVKRCCGLWVYREIQLLQPKVIIILGSPALKNIRGDLYITANRGQWKFVREHNCWSFATFHPSYVLRSENSGKEFISDQFNADIKKIADGWRDIIDNDYRVNDGRSN